jgi:ketosteroid isomerase-like protein
MASRVDHSMRASQHVADRILAALSNLASESLRELLTEDVVLELPFAPAELGPKTVIGLDSVVATMSRARTVYKSLLFTVTERYPVPSADTVIYRAKSEGELIKGGVYRNDYMQLFVFRGDKVSHWVEFFDALKARSAFVTEGL